MSQETRTWIEELAPLFEGAPRFLERLAEAIAATGRREAPGGDWTFDLARRVAHAMPEADQVELLDAHPRLGAQPGTVSAMSFREQGYDRLEGALVPGSETDLGAELDRLNAAYEQRFGFRYCVFVAGRSRAELVPGFEAALTAGEREQELRRGIDAVVDIARDRRAARQRDGATEAGMERTA